MVNFFLLVVPLTKFAIYLSRQKTYAAPLQFIYWEMFLHLATHLVGIFKLVEIPWSPVTGP